MEEDKQLEPQDQPEETPPTEPSAAETPSTESLLDAISEPALEPTPKSLPEEADLAPTPTPLDEAKAESEVQKEPTKFQLFMRKALIWLGVVVAAFLAGFLTFYFTLYRPQSEMVDNLEETVAGLESQIDDLETETEQLNVQLAALEEAEFHSILLDVMTDTYTARLALTVEDTLAAKSALRNTASKLEKIEGELAAFDTGLATGLPARLSLIQSNIDRDVEKAIADADLLIDDLQEVESALFP